MIKYILILIFSNLLFASGSYRAKDNSPENQLRELRDKRKQIRVDLEKIPQFQKDIKKFQKQINKSLIIKKEMENIYSESHQICENQKIEDKFRSNNKNYIETRHKLCVDRINISFNKQKHSKYIKEIDIFHKKKMEEVKELQSLTDQKDVLEIEKEYIDEAINMLEERINFW